MEDIAGFFLWLYNVHLQISPRERRLTIVEKTSETEEFRAKIGHVALKFIAVPGKNHQNATEKRHPCYLVTVKRLNFPNSSSCRSDRSWYSIKYCSGSKVWMV